MVNTGVITNANHLKFINTWTKTINTLCSKLITITMPSCWKTGRESARWWQHRPNRPDAVSIGPIPTQFSHTHTTTESFHDTNFVRKYKVGIMKTLGFNCWFAVYSRVMCYPCLFYGLDPGWFMGWLMAPFTPAATVAPAACWTAAFDATPRPNSSWAFSKLAPVFLYTRWT